MNKEKNIVRATTGGGMLFLSKMVSINDTDHKTII